MKRSSGPGARAVVAALSTILVLAGLGSAATALGGEPSRAQAVSPPFQPARPYWLELTAPQRQALAPLTADWEHLDTQTKKKWVEIANRYPKMKPEEQTRTQERMREWALLTPDQRRVARDSFERVRAMPPEQRADMLRRYQELPPEKREALAQQGTAGKTLVVPKTAAGVGTATSVRRSQIKEGTTVRNPAVAAQKSASPVVAPAPKKAVAPAVAPAAPPPTPTVTPMPTVVAPPPAS